MSYNGLIKSSMNDTYIYLSVYSIFGYNMEGDDPSVANILAWERRKINYMHGLHGARGGLPAYKERLSQYLSSLALGREFGESGESYFKRKGMDRFIRWAEAQINRKE